MLEETTTKSWDLHNINTTVGEAKGTPTGHLIGLTLGELVEVIASQSETTKSGRGSASNQNR